MSIWSRTVSAAKAAVAAFRNPNAFPGEVVQTDRQAYLNLLWSYYQNSTFDDLNTWARYREEFTLYRNIRSIYNPTRRIVNFYVAQVYPGVLSEDADKLPDGVQLAIPLSEDTPDELKTAIAQFWQWANWQSGNRLMVRYGGASGSVLVECVDNVAGGKVSTNVRWPGLVSDLSLDDVGHVKAYTLEYQALDEDGQTFTYRKEVDQESFRYFRNDAPFTPEGAEGAEVENVFGFVPAVWSKHLDEGDDWGAPAISGSIQKIDELNGLASHVHDGIDILIDSPGIISTDGAVGKLKDQAEALKGKAQDEFSAVNATRHKPTTRMLLKGPKDTSWHPLVANMNPDDALGNMDRVLSEIEHDFPELSMYQQLRKMSQVTGPGAARMMGDVYSRVLEVSANYDTQSIKLFQMAVAIAGFRQREGAGGWAMRTEQQKKFAPFDLESYRKGQLDFAIMPRPLIPMTEADAIEIAGKRLENANKASKVLSEKRVLEIAGVPEGEIAAEMSALEQESQANMQRQKDLMAASKPANGDSQFIQ